MRKIQDDITLILKNQAAIMEALRHNDATTPHGKQVLLVRISETDAALKEPRGK